MFHIILAAFSSAEDETSSRNSLNRNVTRRLVAQELGYQRLVVNRGCLDQKFRCYYSAELAPEGYGQYISVLPMPI